MKYTPFLGKYISELTLGTVQLGLQYGIANKNKKPTLEAAFSILQAAYDKGITCFDTAASYGNSESIIGHFFDTNLGKNKEIIIITKLISLNNISTENVKNIIKQRINQSLTNLRTKYIDCLLLHNYEDIFKKNVYEILIESKKKGILGGIGVSVYDPTDLQHILDKFEIDAVQLPFNLFDHRFFTQGLIQKMYNMKITIFARSIFLQGLFFLSKSQIPNHLSQAIPYLQKIYHISQDLGISIAQLAVEFIRSYKEITSIVIGSENSKQVEENVIRFRDPALNNIPIGKILYELKDIPKEIYDPRVWGIK